MEEELRLKTTELEHLQRSYDEFVESSQELEAELEATIQKQQKDNQELEKKYLLLEEKFNTTNELYSKQSTSYNNINNEVIKLKEKIVSLEENKRNLEITNEDLSEKVRILQATEEDYQHKIIEFEEDIVFLKTDIEDLKTHNIELENEFKEKISQLTLELEQAKATKEVRRESLVEFGLDSMTLNNLESENQSQKIDNLELTINELTKHIETLETENSTLSDQVKQLKASSPRKDPNVFLQTSLLIKEQEVNVLNNVIQEKEAKIKEWMNKFEESKNEYHQEIQNLKEEMQNKLTEIKRESSDKKTSVLMESPTFHLARRNTLLERSLSSASKDNFTFKIDSTSHMMQKVNHLLKSQEIDKVKKELNSLAIKYESIRKRNMDLLNKIQTVRGNILVCCRTRPPSDQELFAGGKVIIDSSDESELLCYDERSEAWKSFMFDRVWKTDSNQADVFSDVEPLIISVTEGYNACILAYGQTGSGKTYTMDGYGDQYGVSYRSIQKIFELLETKKSLANAKAGKSKFSPGTRSPFMSHEDLSAALEKEASNPTSTQKPSNSPAPFSPQAPPQPLTNSTGISAETPPRRQSLNEKLTRKRSPSFEFVNPMSSRRPSLQNGQANSLRFEPESQDPFEVRELFDTNELKMDYSSDDDDFTPKDEDESNFKFSVEISMVEIYNEQVYDLLHEVQGGGQTDGTSLDIRQTPDNMIYVAGLRQIKVNNLDEVRAIFAKGAKNRATSSTNLNEHSSRSHLIIQIDVIIQSSLESTIKGKLFLVDLAGSERINKSGATGVTMKEAQYINKSLLSLGDVMEALDQKQKHIPYRNSKLTYLLQNALGGQARTMMVFTVCPTDLTYDESIFTLQFASRIRNISFGHLQRNSNAKNLEVIIKNLKQELKELKRKKSFFEDSLNELKREQKRNTEKSSVPLENKIRTLEENKKTADSLILQVKSQLIDIQQRLHDEKEAKDQLSLDMELIQRNLKKSLEQVKELTLEKEKLQVMLKIKEKELDASRILSRESEIQLDHIRNSPGSFFSTPTTVRITDQSANSNEPAKKKSNVIVVKAVAKPTFQSPAAPSTSMFSPAQSKSSHSLTNSEERKSKIPVSVGGPKKVSSPSNHRSVTPENSRTLVRTSSNSSLLSTSSVAKRKSEPLVKSTPSRFSTSSMSPANQNISNNSSTAVSSRILNITSRSEEALKKHQMRMEKKREAGFKLY